MNNAENIKEAIKDYIDRVPIDTMEFFMYGVQNINSTTDQLMMNFFRQFENEELNGYSEEELDEIVDTGKYNVMFREWLLK